MKEGFLYIATGKKYINEAILSAKSLKSHNELAKIALVTDEPINDCVFNEVIVIEKKHSLTWKEGLSFKVAGLLKSPFEKTFFIDSDTYFTDNTSELFKLLDYFDILMCPSPNDISKLRINNEVLLGISHYNTGVIVYKNNDKIRDLFLHWKDLYSNNPKKYAGDQPAFSEALLKHDVKIYVLTNAYNFRFPFFITIPPLKVKILHGRSSNYSKLNKKINKHIAHRTWSPYWERTFKDYRRLQSTKRFLIKIFGKKKYYKLENDLKKIIKK
ncbi:putative nucleotide-diphospho-sugar transferase [Lacinutrix cladophorae]